MSGAFTWTWEKRQKGWFTSSLGAPKSLGFSWNKHVWGRYLWRGRGYLLPRTSIMGQVMKDGLQDCKKEKENHNFAWTGDGMNPQEKLWTYRCSRGCARQAEAQDGQFHFCRFVKFLQPQLVKKKRNESRVCCRRCRRSSPLTCVANTTREDVDGQDAGRLCPRHSRWLFYSSPVYLGANGVRPERCPQNE